MVGTLVLAGSHSQAKGVIKTHDVAQLLRLLKQRLVAVFGLVRRHRAARCVAEQFSMKVWNRVRVGARERFDNGS